MGEYNFCDDLKSVIWSADLNSKTIEYRLNNFMKACNIELDNGYYICSTSHVDHCYTMKGSNEDKYKVFFSVTKIKDNKELKVSGEYDEIEFDFYNQYKNVNKNKIMEIPFCIRIKKGDFIFNAKSLDNNRVEFLIEKNMEDNLQQCHFYANILDFSKILRLVNAFVTNPTLVFDTYTNIKEAKKVVFTNADIKKGLEDNHNFDKPVSKIRKKIKILTNND